jgi:N utilization substance protein A
MNQDLIRLVDGISRDKNISRDSIFGDLEAAMASAARKKFSAEESEVSVEIDRLTGQINAYLNGEAIDIQKLGRIPAQTAKQVMIQKLREEERGSIYTEYQDRVGDMVSGVAARNEGSTLVVNLGRTEGILPRSEQVPGESHRNGERVRALVYEVKESASAVKIILTRTHPDFIKKLFEQEVPEVLDRIIEIKGLAREAGYRTKVAVTSIDSKVDAVGACVGVRGSRIKNIVDELGGEKIDIVRWNESSQVLIGNALKPAEVSDIALCFELNRATVVVTDDQLSLAIGKRGQNVRLAARLTGWDIDVLTPVEYTQNMDRLIEMLRRNEDMDDTMIDRIVAMGIVSVLDLEEVGSEPIIETLEMDEALVKTIVAQAVEEAKVINTEKIENAATKKIKETAGPTEAQIKRMEEDNTVKAALGLAVTEINVPEQGEEIAPEQGEEIAPEQGEEIAPESVETPESSSDEKEAIESALGIDKTPQAGDESAETAS